MSLYDAWIQTFTGRKFHPLEPRAEDVDLIDIAHSLSHQCRFTGHCRQFYSVAQHSLFVAGIVGLTPSKPPTTDGDDVREALLHDAAEAYLCDLARPIKIALPRYIRDRVDDRLDENGREPRGGATLGPDEFDPFKEIETKIEQAIAERFGLRYPWSDAVKHADMVMLLTERKLLFDHAIPWSVDTLAKPLAIKKIAYMPPGEAEYQFLATCRMLGIK